MLWTAVCPMGLLYCTWQKIYTNNNRSKYKTKEHKWSYGDHNNKSNKNNTHVPTRTEHLHHTEKTMVTNKLAAILPENLFGVA